MTERIRRLLGRPLRVAVLGGGEGAQIGATHRLAMRFNDAFAIVAGVVSSDPEKALSEGAALGLPRAYRNLAALIAGEAGRDDRPDIIAIMTPNDAHAEGCLAALEAGYQVICDKPIANSLKEVARIAMLACRRDRLVCITHNYAGYPMVCQMRAMVRDGTVGPLHQVQVRYAQGNMGAARTGTPGPCRKRSVGGSIRRAAGKAICCSTWEPTPIIFLILRRAWISRRSAPISAHPSDRTALTTPPRSSAD